MIRRRAKATGIQTKIGNHTSRATGITAYQEGRQAENCAAYRGTRIFEDNGAVQQARR